MIDLVAKQHVELEVNTEEPTGVFYLPHHAVKRNAAGKSSGG